MKKYRVTVNGTVYEVELEELTGSAPVSAPAAPAAAPAPAAPAAPAAGEQICAPMPGNILAVNVTAGQAVKKGDVLMVLEAMKMENEIMCPRDGVVASVNTSKGASVESGTAAVRPPVRQGRYGRDHSLFTGHRLLPLFPGRQLALPHHAGHRLRAAVSGHRKEV